MLDMRAEETSLESALSWEWQISHEDSLILLFRHHGLEMIHRGDVGLVAAHQDPVPVTEANAEASLSAGSSDLAAVVAVVEE
jgi:hypothetical protein